MTPYTAGLIAGCLSSIGLLLLADLAIVLVALAGAREKIQ